MANSAALMPICRSIWPLSVSDQIASAICVGAARNSALATRSRLTSSHNSKPPTTDSVPARYFWRATAHMSVGGLGDAGEEQPLDRKRRRDVAEQLQRIEQRIQPALG